MSTAEPPQAVIPANAGIRPSGDAAPESRVRGNDGALQGRRRFFRDAPALAPFRVRSFRFQWPADLLTSWAFEMETLILGWYVLVETESVFLLTVFGSLTYIGTLMAPMFGVLGDRFGRRAMLCAMRAFYAALAAVVMTLGLMDQLSAWYVIAIALLAGLVRQSDLVMRNALIGDTMPADRLMNAIGMNRTTADSARVVGALVGSGLFALLGIGLAYVVVVAFYAIAFVLTFGVATGRPEADPEEAGRPGSRWHDLREGFRYIRATPRVLALIWLAFLINFAAFPFTVGLLPYVAHEVYRIDETGLGHLVAAFATGALTGSIVIALTGGSKRPGRFMLVNAMLWFGLLIGFSFVTAKGPGVLMLLVIGFVQSMSMLSMSVALISVAAERYRARVMGVRMLAVYGLMPGLLVAGGLIEWLGYAPTVWCFVVFGSAVTAWIGWRWREEIWR